MNIPFHKPFVPKSFDEIYSKSIHNGWLTTGPIVQDFENTIRTYTKSKYTIAANSCTAALHLVLASKEFKRNGYSTSFIYGGESEFANIKSYLLNSKFDKIIDKNNFQKKDMNSKWGAHDHIVFNESFIQLKNIEEPFFTTILTLSRNCLATM